MSNNYPLLKVYLIDRHNEFLISLQRTECNTLSNPPLYSDSSFHRVATYNIISERNFVCFHFILLLKAFRVIYILNILLLYYWVSLRHRLRCHIDTDWVSVRHRLWLADKSYPQVIHNLSTIIRIRLCQKGNLLRLRVHQYILRQVS